ncbi:hypothetical protein AA313_de0208029 [Arthrobotrys entomopaga]|nr:hypothetical protein AA313_de0208029 [Arthrobotrys entomopaga]
MGFIALKMTWFAMAGLSSSSCWVMVSSVGFTLVNAAIVAESQLPSGRNVTMTLSTACPPIPARMTWPVFFSVLPPKDVKVFVPVPLILRYIVAANDICVELGDCEGI